MCADGTAPANGEVEFTASWDTITSDGDNFGYDHTVGDDGIYCAFVDAADDATTDNASCDNVHLRSF